ncbi:MAG: hypothetical protein IPM88_20975 [Nitrospira sp.]|nr:hypothetical protein [Nitrospira sp.]
MFVGREDLLVEQRSVTSNTPPNGLRPSHPAPNNRKLCVGSSEDIAQKQSPPGRFGILDRRFTTGTAYVGNPASAKIAEKAAPFAQV